MFTTDLSHCTVSLDKKVSKYTEVDIKLGFLNLHNDNNYVHLFF